jgi:hypothetical protein
MSYLFLGGASMSRFSPLDSNAFESTDASGFQSDIGAFAIKIASAHSGVESEHWAEAADLWIHACHYNDNTDGFFSTADCIEIVSEAGVTLARCRPVYTSSGVFNYKWWTLQGGVETVVGTATGTTGAVRTLDVNLVGNTASGSLAFYINGTQLLSVSGLNHSGFTGGAYVRLGGSASSGSPRAYWSEVAAASHSLIGKRFETRRPTGNSAANLGYGAGDYSTVDDITYSDVDGITSASANEVRTFTYDATNANGWAIDAVGPSDRVKAGATGPQNEQKALRIGSTNYFSSTKALTPGYSPKGGIWETDPSTSAAWADLPDEFGAKSIT